MKKRVLDGLAMIGENGKRMAAIKRHTPAAAPERPDGRRLGRSLATLIGLVAIVVGVIVGVPGLHAVAASLADVDARWVALAVALELLSCGCYVIAFRLVFTRTPRRFAARVAWAELAFQSILPAGGAGGAAVAAWVLHEKGFSWARIAERSAVLFLLTSAINVLALTLFGLLLAVGVLAGPHHLLLGLVPAGVGAGVFLFFLALPRILTPRVCTREWKHRRLRATLIGLADAIRDTERILFRPDWRLIGPIGYLAFDIAVLWVCFLAFGHHLGAAPLVLGYLIGYLGNIVPIPGGIGPLDGGLIGAFVLYGVKATTATTAVLVYHVLALWVPLLIGSVAFVLLRRSISEPLTPWPLTEQAPVSARSSG